MIQVIVEHNMPIKTRGQFAFLAFIVCPIVFTSVSFAQTSPPRLINLQAVLVDEGGNVLYNTQEADIIFSIVDGAGETFYEEEQHVVLVNGAISVLVGQGVDLSTGGATGGIPLKALEPNGTKLLRVKLKDQSIPQEDLELATVPYAMYADKAYSLVEPLDSSGILDESLEQVDLSPALLEFINNSVAGVSQADLIAHKAEENAHNAETIFVRNAFINASGNDLQTVLEGLDRSIGTRRNEEGVLGEAIDTETADRISDVDTEQTARETAVAAEQSAREAAISAEALARTAADSAETTAREAAISAEAFARATAVAEEAAARASADFLEASSREAADASLNASKVNRSGDTITGTLSMSGADISMSTGRTVDGVDISELKNTVDNHLSNTSNPHSVTVSQIGAAPTSHSHAFSDISSGQVAEGQIPQYLRPFAFGVVGGAGGNCPVLQGYNLQSGGQINGSPDCRVGFTRNPTTINYVILMTTGPETNLHEDCIDPYYYDKSSSGFSIASYCWGQNVSVLVFSNQ